MLRLVGTGRVAEAVAGNPFLWGIEGSAWFAFARANGMTAAACESVMIELDAAVAVVDGHGFRVTPLARADRLSSELGFGPSGGVYVKDETGNVAGSHKARHLMSILAHLRVAEVLGLAPHPGRPRLAIASCGNAALAATTLAAAVDWPIVVYVPVGANPAITSQLTDMNATVVTCPRRGDDPPGDPCVHRFREAVDAGAIPFSTQGPENAWCLDGGRTLGWEIGNQIQALDVDTVFVQVGGGALATAVGDGTRQVLGRRAPRLVAVQTQGCAPLDRAWRRALELGVDAAPSRWGECMWPWETEPASAAGGILDDETYDWVGVTEAMAATSGRVAVVSEDLIGRANRLVQELTSIDADHTGSAGLAGLLAEMATTAYGDRQVLVILSGLRRV